MSPSGINVLFMRHAEKYPVPNPSITALGECRANSLSTFLQHTFGMPQKIYATRPNDQYVSMRPLETVLPLAQHLDMAIDLSFTIHQNYELANALVHSVTPGSNYILVCWEHHTLGRNLNALGIPVVSWGQNPLATKDDDTDFRTIYYVKILPSVKTLTVYPGFTVSFDPCGQCVPHMPPQTPTTTLTTTTTMTVS